MQNKYYVSAVIKGNLIESVIFAKSAKQAWYFFGKNNGFAMRDFKILGVEEPTPESLQIKMNI